MSAVMGTRKISVAGYGTIHATISLAKTSTVEEELRPAASVAAEHM
jgi:hypothetical protein